MAMREKPAEKVWADFKESNGLTEEQLEKFQKYAKLLVRWNAKCNLTAINGLSGIVNQHFTDSLALRDAVDLTKVKTIADVGTGAGFPVIPLKILFPHLNVILIEVKQKKQEFLRTIIHDLVLDAIQLCPLDWRTFLRSTEGKVDLFVSKAAMGEVELSRLFRANCSYRDAEIAYWVTEGWECDSKVKEKYLLRTFDYKFRRNQQRRLAFFKAS
ncbi:16S rRNA (guanine(527)-N(7))-methyltransferase RsmG [bacterium]|nr:16S rRNA (guanine(527)-N(7))-methyltransferase RsmG [bacterium]